MGGNKNSKQKDFSWDTFVFLVFYLGNIPQLLTKFVKAKDMPALIETEPEKLIVFWNVILVVLITLIAPALIAGLITPKNIFLLKNWNIKIIPIGWIIYISFWILAFGLFIFYLATEIAGIQQL